MQQSIQPNYPDLLKVYHALGLALELGCHAHSICTAIIHKANELFFKTKKISMSIPETIKLTGLTEKQIQNARPILLQLKITGKYLITYKPGRRNTAGVYTFNWRLLCQYSGSGLPLVWSKSGTAPSPSLVEGAKTSAIITNELTNKTTPEDPVTPVVVYTNSARARSKEVAVLRSVEFKWISKQEAVQLTNQYGESRVFESAVVIDKLKSARSKIALLKDSLSNDYVPELPQEELEKMDRKEQLQKALALKLNELESVVSLDPSPENFSNRYPSGREMKPEEAKDDRIFFLEEQIQKLRENLETE